MRWFPLPVRGPEPGPWAGQVSEVRCERRSLGADEETTIQSRPHTSPVEHRQPHLAFHPKTFEQKKVKIWWADCYNALERIHISVEAFLFAQQTNLSSSPSKFSFAMPSITNSTTSFSLCLLFQSSMSLIQSSDVSGCFFSSSQESFGVCKPTPWEKLELYWVMHRMKVESCFLLCSSFQRIDVFTILQFRKTQINTGLKRAADENIY